MRNLQCRKYRRKLKLCLWISGKATFVSKHHACAVLRRHTVIWMVWCLLLKVCKGAGLRTVLLGLFIHINQCICSVEART